MKSNIRGFSSAAQEAVKTDFRRGTWLTFERYRVIESSQNLVAWEGYEVIPERDRNILVWEGHDVGESFQNVLSWGGYSVREINQNILAWEGYDVRPDKPGALPYACVPADSYDPGLAYVYAPNEARGSCEVYQPLVDTPALFLEFARLVDEDITRAVWMDWIHRYGVLGLGLHNPRQASCMEIRSAPIGGAGETYKNFVREASKANWLLRLYEYAKSPEEPVGGKILPIGFKLQGYGEWYEPLTVPEVNTPAKLKDWALDTVHFEINLYMRQCFPKLYPSTGEPQFVMGWDFYSLLGAMYIQLAWLVAAKGEEVRWCKMPGCGKVIAFEQPTPPKNSGLRKNARGKYKTRTDKEFCDEDCKGKYHYHYRTKPKRQGQRS